jgi:hypothetical protein
VMAAMASPYHAWELTAPLPVVTFICTVAYIWRFAHEARGHCAVLPALAHP